MNRLGPSFHRTFALNRPAVSEILRLARAFQDKRDRGRVLDFKLIEDNTTLGPVYISSMRRYAFGTGLLDKQERLTEMGSFIVGRDPGLQGLETCWLLHYRLSSKQGLGPLFWGILVQEMLRPGDVLGKPELADVVRRSAKESDADDVNERTANQAATVFLGTYCKPDALGPLGILEQIEAGRYSVNEPGAPHLWAFGYVLADYWQTHWGAVRGVPVSRVMEPGGPASLLMMGAGTVNRYLGELQAADLVTVQRRMPPFQLNRNWSNPRTFLERLYG